MSVNTHCMIQVSFNAPQNGKMRMKNYPVHLLQRKEKQGSRWVGKSQGTENEVKERGHTVAEAGTAGDR